MRIYVDGTLLEAKTASFPDRESGKDITFGRVEVMCNVDNGFHKIQWLKVRTDNFGMLSEAAEKMRGKQVTVEAEEQEYKGKRSLYAVKVMPQQRAVA